MIEAYCGGFSDQLLRRCLILLKVVLSRAKYQLVGIGAAISLADTSEVIEYVTWGTHKTEVKTSVVP